MRHYTRIIVKNLFLSRFTDRVIPSENCYRVHLTGSIGVSVIRADGYIVLPAVFQDRGKVVIGLSRDIDLKFLKRIL